MLLLRQTREEHLKIHIIYKQAKRRYTPQERYTYFTGYTPLMLLPRQIREEHLKIDIIYKQAKRRYTSSGTIYIFYWLHPPYASPKID
jgi:TRAP-type mannitol/chloroaromatic compound transport system permease small subunit